MEYFNDDYEAVEYYLEQDIRLDEIMQDVLCDYISPRVTLGLLDGSVSEEDKKRVYNKLLDEIVSDVVTDLDFSYSWPVDNQNDPKIRRICEEWLMGVAV